MSNDTLYADLADAWLAKRAADEAQKEAARAYAELEREALDRMVEQGIQRIAIHGVTLYVHRQLWARPATENGEDKAAAYARACAALEQAGLGAYVHETFNVHSLSAHYRELATEEKWETPEDLLDAPLRGVITLTEDYSVRGRKA